MVEPTPALELVTRDPVCGMPVDPQAGKPCFEHDGRTYHFCHDGCRDKFVMDPELYIEAVDPVCGMKVNRATASISSRGTCESVPLFLLWPLSG